MLYDKDKIKNSLSLEQIIEIVQDLGAAAPQVHGEMFMCETICHNIPGEGSYKLYYYDNTKLFKCYTGCGEYFDIFQLVQKSYQVQYEEEWSLPKAVAWVAQKFGFETLQQDGFEEHSLEDWTIFKLYERIVSKVEKGKRVSELKEYDRSILKNLGKPVIGPWLREGISQATIDKYDIGFYSTESQITIPHFDDRGRFIGLRGRALSKEDGERYGKYRPLRLINGFMYNHPLGFALYGLNENKLNIERVKKAIVFEGEKSVLLYDSYFGSDNNISVASCGNSLSSFQFELLLKNGVQEIIFAYDRQYQEIGDKEFKQYVKSLQQMANKYKNYVTVSCMFDKKGLLAYKSSPIDHGEEVFIELFKNRIIM